MTTSGFEADGWIGRWSPGIGDPTVMGWLTVLLYAIGAWQCFRLASTHAAVIGRGDARLWRILALALLLLGINKQLDLQSALTELGRMVAAQQGWYAQRHAVQEQFIRGVIAVAGIAAIVLTILAYWAHPATVVALVGSAFLLAFIVIRAASFHHFDVLIRGEYLGLKLNWILEMGGIGIIIAGARWRLRAARVKAGAVKA
jgi:hypothetical protein